MVATVIEIAEDGSARIYVFQRDSQGVARLSMQQVKGIQNIPDWVAKQRARLGVSGTYVFVHIGPDSRVKAEQPVARTLDGKAFRPAYNFFGWGPGALGDRFVSHSFSLREAERDSAFNILKISLTAVGVGRFYLKPLYEVAPAKQ